MGPRTQAVDGGGAHGVVAAAPPPLLPLASSPAAARLLLWRQRPRRRGRRRRRRRLEAERRRGLRRRAGRQRPPPPLRRPPLLTGAVSCFRLDFHSVPLPSHCDSASQRGNMNRVRIAFASCVVAWSSLSPLLIGWRIIVPDQID